MFACRAAWRRCGRLALRPRGGDVFPHRMMSSVPGGSGQNIVYAVLCGGAFAAAVTYTYRTVAADQARFNHRVTQLSSRSQNEWKPRPWPPKSGDGGDEASEEGELTESVEAPQETLAEAVGETVVEVAEAVAEVAEGVAEAALEVAEVAQEVEKVAKEVEEVVAEEVLQAEENASESTVESSDSLIEEDVAAEVEPELHVPPAAEEDSSQAPVASSSEEEDSVAVVEEPLQAEGSSVVSEEEPEPVQELELAPQAEEIPVLPLEVETPVHLEVEDLSAAPAVEIPAVIKVPLTEEVPAPPVVEEVAITPDAEEIVEEPLPPGPEEHLHNETQEEPGASPDAEESTPSDPEGPLSGEAKRELVVVVLEGSPKSEKKPKVLGVSPVTGRIIPGPEEDEKPSAEGKRRLLKVQMQ